MQTRKTQDFIFNNFDLQFYFVVFSCSFVLCFCLAIIPQFTLSAQAKLYKFFNDWFMVISLVNTWVATITKDVDLECIFLMMIKNNC